MHVFVEIKRYTAKNSTCVMIKIKVGQSAQCYLKITANQNTERFLFALVLCSVSGRDEVVIVLCAYVVLISSCSLRYLMCSGVLISDEVASEACLNCWMNCVWDFCIQCLVRFYLFILIIFCTSYAN